MKRCLCLAVACLLPIPAWAQDGIPQAKLDELKAATVFIKVEGKEHGGYGSGFLIHVEGENGLVATNNHVVAVGGQPATSKITVVFSSGSPKERSVAARVIAADREQDLAVLALSGKNLPNPLNLTQPAQAQETMTVYTCGFPLGPLLASGERNPEITISRASVSSLRTDDQGRLKRIQLHGELNPGNSGGPIVTPDGKLVGIAVTRIVGTAIGFAIPPAELTDILRGRAGTAAVRSIRVTNGTAEVDVEIPLIDPLGQVKSVELRHAPKPAGPGPKPDATGNWPDLVGAGRVPVKIENGKATARVTIRGTEKKPVDYLFQTVYVNATGRPTATEPQTRGIDFAASGLVRAGSRYAGQWETVNSKEGGFIVDMPKKPSFAKSQTKQTSAGPMKLFITGCDTEVGHYVVFRIDLPVAIPRGQEERILDSQRNLFAEIFTGKVVSEKKLTYHAIPGRDFTIRGKPEGDEESTIRMREYLSGKTIFALALASPPNKELPEDAGRFLGSMALGEAMYRAKGTVVPDPPGTELKGWGVAIDPDKDCTFSPGDRSLRLEVPAVNKDLGGPKNLANAPRVMREVEGDFTLTVKVGGDFTPGPGSTNPKSIPYLAAGVVAWVDSNNFIRLERTAMRRGAQVTANVAFLEQEGGYGAGNHSSGLRPGGDCYLRLERRGSQIRAALSPNGTNWNALKPIDTIWPDRIKVGLMAITTSNAPFTVKFEQFDFKAGGEQ